VKRPSLPGVTPADPDDTGAADPALRAAIAARDTAAVGAALPGSRLLVPVVAVPDAGEATMAVPALVNAGGARALPAFTGLDALHAWRPDARPVPMVGARVIAAVVAEGYDGLVLDVAGPVAHTLLPDDLRRIAPGC
jgi:hypothetical protein